MKALLLALCVACIPVAAETPEAGGEDLVTFTRAQLDQLQRELEGIVRKREAAAFQAGQSDVRQRCASLI